jgi:2-C-methyl-D-erythritol 4-phosphate cytidylyltransferase
VAVAPRVIALVPAAGRGSRFGGDGRKQFVLVAGRPLLAWTVERLLAAGCDEVVVAVPPGEEAGAAERAGSPPRVRWIAGGASRQESVRRCLASATGEPGDLVVVHDGARPAVAPSDVRAAIAAAREVDGAVLGRPVDDTLKRTEDGRIVGTVSRQGLFRAETPQVFRREVLERAHAAALRAGREATDEAGLVEQLPALVVRAVHAEHPNPKLTRLADLPLLERLLAENG